MPPRPPPSTLESLEVHALREPRRHAVVENGNALDYGGLHTLVLRCASRLTRAGVRAGDRVAVAECGFAAQLVALIAAESLGAATASVGSQADADAPALLRHVQWVVSGWQHDVPAGCRPLDVQALLAAPDRPDA